jgi:hypothetical protein
MAVLGSDDSSARTRLAFIVVGLSIVGVVGVSAVALAFAKPSGRPEMARLVFTSILPLLGTWVGTVLAYYYSRENLEAATASTINTLQAAGGLAATTPVTAVMIRADAIKPRKDVTAKADAEQIPLKDFRDLMQAEKQSRVPIFDASGAALYIVHEPDIDKYAQLKGMMSESLQPADTLGSLLEQPELKAAIETFAAVGPAATVDEARAQLRAKPQAKDLFVTAGGRETDKVLGWLTNSDLARIV